MQHQPTALAMGNSCWRQGDRAGALAAYRRAIRDQPLFGVPYRNLARLLGQAGEPLLALADDLEGAEPGLRRLVSRLAPGSAELAAQLGWLAATPLFDGPWYEQQHPELALVEIDPAEHWLRCGIAMGWNPSGQFDSRFYVEHHRMRLGGLNPLLHYLQQGQAAGLASTPAVFCEALRRSTCHLWGPERHRAEAALRKLLADQSTPFECRSVGGQQLAAALGWWGRWPEAEAAWMAMPDGRARNLGLALLLQQKGRAAEAVCAATIR